MNLVGRIEVAIIFHTFFLVDEEIDLDTLVDCKIDEKIIEKAGPRTKFLRLRDAWKQSLDQHNFPV